MPFTEELRKRRLGAGLSLTALSAVVHYREAQLSKVARGVKAPSRDLARLCDAALHAGGALIALVAQPVTDVPKEPAPYGVEEEEWVMRLSPDGSSGFQPVGRPPSCTPRPRGELVPMAASPPGTCPTLSLHAARAPVGGTVDPRPSHPCQTLATLPTGRPLTRRNTEVRLEY
ncbi:helix-turn-helix domain-containing protein [Streptomyces mirabilis]